MPVAETITPVHDGWTLFKQAYVVQTASAIYC